MSLWSKIRYEINRGRHEHEVKHSQISFGGYKNKRKWKYCEICRKWLKHGKKGKYILGGRSWK